MTTLFLATTGGHLDQLDDLAARIPAEGDAFWVTHDNEQSRSLLHGRDVEFVPYVRMGDLRDVARCVPIAHRLWGDRKVTRAVSTGSGIALGFLPYLAARGVACHYVESAARVEGPSITGRVLERTPRIRRYTQYRSWADRRWSYAGSVFDTFRPVAEEHRPFDVLRVVVTVGTAADHPFDRLIERLVPLLGPGGQLAAATALPVEVLWQTGSARTGHLPISATPFLAADELAAALAVADIVVSHAGTGSALGALGAGRCPVMASRSSRLREANDDHQVELGDELARRRLAIHRDPSDITVDDLLATMETTVRRRSDPPTFELLP